MKFKIISLNLEELFLSNLIKNPKMKATMLDLVTLTSKNKKKPKKLYNNLNTK